MDLVASGSEDQPHSLASHQSYPTALEEAFGHKHPRAESMKRGADWDCQFRPPRLPFNRPNSVLACVEFGGLN